MRLKVKNLKIIYLIILLGLLLSCLKNSLLAEEHYHGENFSYKITFESTFIARSIVEIVKTKDIGKIKFTFYDHNKKSKSKTIIISKLLLKDDFHEFFNILDTISLIHFSSLKGVGIDGIYVFIDVKQENKKNFIHFWSPRKLTEPIESRIVEAIFYLLRKKIAEKKAIFYLDKLEDFFDFGLPFRISKIHPLEIRIYNTLEGKYWQEFSKFIDSLPSNQPILIDLSNLKWMDEGYYPFIQNLIKRNNQIIWIAKIKDKPREQLIELGISQDKIFNDIKKGRVFIKKIRN